MKGARKVNVDDPEVEEILLEEITPETLRDHPNAVIRSPPAGQMKPKQQAKDRRRLFSGFLQFRFQLKYGMLYLAVALVSLALINGLFLYIMIKTVVHSADPKNAQQHFGQMLLSVLRDNAAPVAIGVVAIIGLFLWVGIIFTRRIVGPTHALVRHIRALRGGNYDYKTNLRKDDELKGLMQELNELSDVLKRRHGPKPPRMK